MYLLNPYHGHIQNIAGFCVIIEHQQSIGNHDNQTQAAIGYLLFDNFEIQLYRTKLIWLTLHNALFMIYVSLLEIHKWLRCLVFHLLKEISKLWCSDCTLHYHVMYLVLMYWR